MNENEKRTLRDEIAGIVAEYCIAAPDEAGRLDLGMSSFAEAASPAHLVERLAEHLAPLADLRPEVYIFAVAMEMKLRQNDYKDDYHLMTTWELFDRLVGEAGELHPALQAGAGILPEAVDVANFCMMIADVAGEVEHFARHVMGRDEDIHAR